MIANYQYGWTFFVPDIQKQFGWKPSDIQVAFTLFVLFETWLVPIEGWFVDRFGPRIVIFVGGILCGIGWWMTSRATSLGGIDGYYSAMIVCGIGAGGEVGFADHEGLGELGALADVVAIRKARVRLGVAARRPPRQPENVRQPVLDRCGRQHQAIRRIHLAHTLAHKGFFALHLHALVNHHAIKGVERELLVQCVEDIALKRIVLA
jgi:hypothetical protein